MVGLQIFLQTRKLRTKAYPFFTPQQTDNEQLHDQLPT